MSTPRTGHRGSRDRTFSFNFFYIQPENSRTRNAGEARRSVPRRGRPGRGSRARAPPSARRGASTMHEAAEYNLHVLRRKYSTKYNTDRVQTRRARVLYANCMLALCPPAPTGTRRNLAFNWRAPSRWPTPLSQEAAPTPGRLPLLEARGV